MYTVECITHMCGSKKPLYKSETIARNKDDIFERIKRLYERNQMKVDIHEGGGFQVIEAELENATFHMRITAVKIQHITVRPGGTLIPDTAIEWES